MDNFFNSYLAIGTYSIPYKNRFLSSGIYLCTLEFNTRIKSIKIIIIK